MSSDRDRKLELALKHELRAAGMPERDACVDAETLGAWADGGLDPAQMAAVELHVASCARCQAIVGVAARSAPIAPVAEAPAGFSMWKWWLAPIAAGAAAVTLWMVVPEETTEAPPTAPAPVIEASKDAPAARVDERLADASRKPAAPAPSGLENRQSRRGELLERKQERSVADQAAIGAVASAPPAVAPAAPAAAEATLQKSLRASATVEIVSPDPRHRWRVVAGAIERSDDAGASWLPAQSAAGDRITGGTAPAAAICWLIGANGTVWVSADGATFARVPIPAHVDLTAITAGDAFAATVTTADGREFRTVDSGRTWRQTQGRVQELSASPF